MNGKIMSIVALAAITAAIGCNSSSNNANSAPKPEPAQAQGPEWALTLNSDCTGAVATEQCVGKYGFSVNADGTYTVGPGPAGQTLTGKVDDAKFAELKIALNSSGVLTSVDSFHQESCTDHETSETSDTVNFSRRGKPAVVVNRSDANQFCFKASAAESAQELYSALKALADTYYSLPFPNACTDAAESFEKTFAQFQTCKVDADCAYVDESFTAVAPDLEQSINDTCSVAKPMYIANRSVLNDAATAKLQQGSNDVQQACIAQQVYAREGCQAGGISMTASTQPVCRLSSAGGTCTINPGVSRF